MKKFIQVFVGVAASALTSMIVNAAESELKSEMTVSKAQLLQRSEQALALTNQDAQKAQRRVEALDDKTQALLQDYRITHSEIDQLTLFK